MAQIHLVLTCSSFYKILTGLFIFAVISGCNNIKPTLSKITEKASSQSSTSTQSSSTNTTCNIFAANGRDFQTCQRCVQSLGRGATDTQIIRCVHENVSASVSGGSCSIPKCGPNQIVDKINCVCRDATSEAAPATPGQEDTLTPYVQIGFQISDRFCSAKNTACTQVLASPPAMSTLPQHTSEGPANLHQDLGYLRWDLALDASIYDIASVISLDRAFRGTQSTFIGNHHMYFKLKPNTVLSSTSVAWQDCVEHFSGSMSSGLSTYNFCDSRTASTNTAAPKRRLVPISPGTSSGIASLNLVSMNGGAANINITDQGTTINPAVNKGFGLAKLVHPILGETSADTASSGLMSNVGYYKFSFGPLSVRRPGTTTDIASATVSQTIAMNTNLGYSPASAVNSTAMAPESITNSVPTRDCTTTTVNPNPCVLTLVYRGSGGAVLFQNFSPRFPLNQSSSIGVLPSGITAVSTPKIIEDVSQLTSSLTTVPARVRVFVRAQDGNIYMNRGQNGKWSTWLSLGKPWTCGNTVGSQCATDITSFSPQLYQPFDTGAVTLSANDGISIAGEPVVASFMDTSTSPIRGYIGVFARVSHMRSSDGAPGIYHNAVFYTLAAATSSYPSSATQSFDFDKVATWSRWMPLRDDDQDRFRIQGNPLVFMRKVVGQVMVYAFGTQLESAGGPVLHPPISKVNRPVFDATAVPSNAGQPTGYAMQNYFNYGSRMIRTSLHLTNTSGVGLDVSSFSAAPTHSFGNATQWNPINATARTTTFIGAGTTGKDRIIVSDWSSFDMSTSTVRLFANEIYNFGATTSGGNNDAISPQSYYKRQLHFFEFTLKAKDSDCTGSASCIDHLCTSGVTCVDGACSESTDLSAGVNTYRGGFYPFIRFIGNVTPVDLSGTATSGTVGNPVDADGNQLFLFGRAVIMDKSKGNATDPSAAYAVVPKAAHCSPITTAVGTEQTCSAFSGTACTAADATRLRGAGQVTSGAMYYAMYSDINSSYEATTVAGATTSANVSKNMLQPVLVTSDVMAFPHPALDVASFDVPVFLITRDIAGKITQGIFPSRNGGTSGGALFIFNPVGEFTN